MKNGMTLEYESREDSFRKTQDVRSRFVWGDPDAVPNPWMTVLIPTYRRYNLLEEALNSVLTQWHVDFLWDIVVVDNEPDDGVPNDTEQLIRSINNRRILYYRNGKNIRPGDNFNRGFLLARGEWVMMLHDDDLLAANAMQAMERLIHAYDGGKRPLGAIAAQYIQFEYDAQRNEVKADIPGMNAWLCAQPPNYSVYKLTHTNVRVFAHIGGSVPSNGSTFRRQAVLEAGGFNEDFGISGDLILFYNLENDYEVYQTLFPLGFYRWGSNSMMKRESTFRVVRDGYDFREYVYAHSSRLVGLLRKCHYKRFTTDVVRERNNVSSERMRVSDFDMIYSKRPNPVVYFLYSVFCKLFGWYKKLESRRLAKQAERRLKALEAEKDCKAKPLAGGGYFSVTTPLDWAAS